MFISMLSVKTMSINRSKNQNKCVRKKVLKLLKLVMLVDLFDLIRSFILCVIIIFSSVD